MVNLIVHAGKWDRSKCYSNNNNDKKENNVRKVCEEIVSLSPFALEKIKKNVKIATLGNLNTLLKAEAKSLIECTYSKEHKEAVKNFIRKK